MSRRPVPAMPTLFRRLAFAQVLLAIGAFCLAEGSVVLALVAMGLAAVAWVVVERRGGSPFSNRTILIGSLLAILALPLEILLLRPPHIIQAVGHFTIWLQLLQLFSHKGNRDYALLLLLSLLQMVGACLLSESLLFALFLLGFIALTLVTAVVFHFKLGGDQVEEANRHAAAAMQRLMPTRSQTIRPGPDDATVSAPDDQRPRTASLRFRPHENLGSGGRWQLRGVLVQLIVLSLLVAGLVFVVLPRSARSAGAGQAETPGSIGYSRQIHLGGPSPVPGSRAIVLTMTITIDGQPIGLNAPHSLRLLRGAVMDRYDPVMRTWHASARDAEHDVDLPLVHDQVTLAEWPTDRPRVTAHLTLRSGRQAELFSPRGMVALRSEDMDRVTFNPREQLLWSARATERAPRYDLTLATQPPGDLEQRYEAALEPSQQLRLQMLRRREVAEARPEPAWEVDAPQIQALALAMLSEAGFDPVAVLQQAVPARDVAQTLTRSLQKGYRYSLDQPATPAGDDPISHFLQTSRAGHCELFASGLAALARSVGLHARVVSGYVAVEYNPVGGYFTLRQSDAHAWTEIDCPGEGWITFDATPPGQLRQALRPEGGDAWWVSLLDHAQFAWLDSVIAFSPRTQHAVMENLGQTLRPWPGSMLPWRRWLAAAGAWYDALRLDTLSLALLLTSLALLLVLMATLVRWRLGVRWGGAGVGSAGWGDHRQAVRSLRFYPRMLRLLAQHGHARRHTQTPRAFAHSLVQLDPLRFEAVLPLTEHYYTLRYGQAAMDAPRQRAIRRHLERLRECLASHAG